MQRNFYSSDSRQMKLPEQNLNNIMNVNINNQYDIRNLHEQKEYAAYNFYDYPKNMDLLDQNNKINNPLSSSYYKQREANVPSIILNNKNSYMNTNNELMRKSNNFLNIASVPPKDIEHFEYANPPINLNEENYCNYYDMNNNVIPTNESLKYEVNNDINRTQLINNLSNKLNNSYININNGNCINEEIMNNEVNNYKELNNLNNSFDYLNYNINNMNSNYVMDNYNSALSNNIKNIPYNSIYTNNYNNENYHSLNIDNSPMLFNKNAQEINEKEINFSKLKDINMNKNITNTLDQLQAVVCLQKLEEIPAPFLNINEIKYSVSVYFNSYDDIIDKYQSKFYSCKLNELYTYADCDLQNEIINLPFNNEEFIYLKVIETSIYKTEIIGRLQLKVKSLSQEYPLRIPIIGDDGNSKGFLIMNFFVTSSYYDVKNDILTEKETLPNKTKATRLRRRNNGFHFFENFTKWCCEITDDHIN
ncbi:conserved Plasmodium protein, unknown function [Plasmodium relictum]|uniref:Uncharacterized protein n=1 Tax=Plasmodium relictum TaxID=85471 RepID=A0A1J1HAI3_PLARL|nr:conserved Plasmodium protein, unknown function [Plasmodium relictum]CRH02403.1 conserved Plasmodium protein, unknown function [Plasmodium relictum]